MTFSEVGKWKVASHVLLFVFDIVVLALAAKVNKFNDFFYVADIFPLAISIVTLVVLFVMLSLDFALVRSPLGLPLVEAGILGVLSIFWLAFNAFSTSRWNNIPMQCAKISIAFSEERAWCKDVQALKAFVWITFVTCLLITLWTLQFTFREYKRGSKQILKTPLAHYSLTTTSSNRASSANWFNNGAYVSEVYDGRAGAGAGVYGYGNGSGYEGNGNGEKGSRGSAGSDFLREKNPFERMPMTPPPPAAAIPPVPPLPSAYNANKNVAHGHGAQAATGGVNAHANGASSTALW